MRQVTYFDTDIWGKVAASTELPIAESVDEFEKTLAEHRPERNAAE